MFDNLANNQNSSTKFDDTNNSKMAGQSQTGDATTSGTSYSTTDETLITSDTSNNFEFDIYHLYLFFLLCLLIY